MCLKTDENQFKTNINLSDTQRLISYCAVNMLHLGYKSQLVLYIEIIAVCSEIHTIHINTMCIQNEEFRSVKTGGTRSNYWGLRVWFAHQLGNQHI